MDFMESNTVLTSKYAVALFPEAEFFTVIKRYFRAFAVTFYSAKEHHLNFLFTSKIMDGNSRRNLSCVYNIFNKLEN